MIHPALAFVLDASPAAAPHGPGCAPSTSDCLVIPQETVAEQLSQIEDERTFSPSKPALPRSIALIERQFARRSAGIRHLPVPIANEGARLGVCDAQAESVRLGTAETVDLRCR